jgi:hypothetical protein
MDAILPAHGTDIANPASTHSKEALTMADDDKTADKAPAPRRTGEARGARRTDARHDPGKLRENQQRLGVGPEHRTEAMKKGHRGTFP